MKVAVNTRLLLKDKLEGIGWFTFEVMKRMVKNHPEVEFLFLFDRPYSEDFIFSSNVKAKVVFPQARHPILYHWWFEYSIPKILIREKVDVFFSPEGFVSLKSKVPTINVLHDINFVHEPEAIKSFDRKHFLKYFPKYAHKADTVITVSNFSKNDILKHYKLPEGKIVVAYNGVGEQYRTGSPKEILQTREKYSEGCEYLLFVGSMQPRKNITRLMLAFDEMKKSSNDASIKNVKLLLVGNKHVWTNEMEKAFSEMSFSEDVIFTGRVNGDDLVNIYAAAKALTYVPVFEGFGLPIVEGFKSGIPVITSNISSMPEVAGEAALLVDPYNVEDISQAMIKVMTKEKLTKELVEKGFKQAALFSWDRTEEIIWKEIEKL
ncbi:MAG: glycosyltransferase involved in cell wall biosynthesis [Patiriisocius sp.]|jgi:glycosyltransferase involved in cell wall biosynthesis